MKHKCRECGKVLDVEISWNFMCPECVLKHGHNGMKDIFLMLRDKPDTIIKVVSLANVWEGTVRDMFRVYKSPTLYKPGIDLGGCLIIGE